MPQKATKSDPSRAPSHRLLKVREAADDMSVSTRTVRRLVRLHELDAVRLGRCVRIKAESIDALLARGGAA